MTGKGKAYTMVGALAAIIATVFAVEGGYVNNPRDPGGETNHGITQTVARNHGYKGEIRDMPKEFAEYVYRRDYIERPGFDRLVARSPAVGKKVIDIGVNAGPARASRWVQEAINHLSRGCQDYPCITVDARIGPATIAAYQALEKRRGRVKACELTIKLLDARQATHYTSLRMPTFVVGWVDHRIGNVPLSQCADRVEG